MKRIWLAVGLTAAMAAGAAERVFDLGGVSEGKLPAGFRSALAGQGALADWRVVLDELPPLLAPLSSNAPVVTRRPVLAQVSRDTTDERFPLLIYDGESFGDFTLTTRFKLVDGQAEQMAGVAFRLQDERNFYVIRASALGRNIRFYKVVAGQRSAPIGPELDLPRGVWHELKIECRGNQILCHLNGREAIPPLMDTSFNAGKVALWTKSDSVSYFADTRIVFTPRVPLAQALVASAVKKYPKLLGLKIVTPVKGGVGTVVAASKDPADVGQPGDKFLDESVAKGTVFYGQDKEKEFASVTMPLRDRNGDIVGAVKVIMKRLAGQTESNAIVRATPIVRFLQSQIVESEEFLR